MTKYLIKFDEDYCDEFNVKGFSILNAEEMNKLNYVKEHVKELADDTYYVGFGSNEDIEFENVSEFLNCLNINEITDEEYNIINKHFGQNYGLIWIYNHIECLYDDLTVDYSKE